MSVAFPPRNETVEFFNALNTFYKDTGKRDEVRGIHVDPEGLGVWNPEYLRLRVNGYSHAEAQADVFASILDIWDPSHAPHPRPTPPVEVPPVQPPAPPTGGQFSPDAVAKLYEVLAKDRNFQPNHLSTDGQRREHLRLVMMKVRENDDTWWMKRNDNQGRPISDETVIHMPDRTGYDLITAAGTAGYVIRASNLGRLPGPEADNAHYQPLVDPFTLQIVAG